MFSAAIMDIQQLQKDIEEKLAPCLSLFPGIFSKMTWILHVLSLCPDTMMFKGKVRTKDTHISRNAMKLSEIYEADRSFAIYLLLCSR